MTYILSILGFVILIKGADWLVEGASSIARRLKISNLVIGLTVVAFGTSTPELVINIIASLKGSPELAIGNILGSNIANIFLILGVSSIIYPLTVHKNTVWKEIPLSLLAVLVIAVMANDVLIDRASQSIIAKSDGLILLLFFTIFLYYTLSIAKVTDESGGEVEQLNLLKSIVFVIVGLAGLVIGGDWIVKGAVAMASRLGMSQTVIGLTVVAIGTSLPELATSVVATYKRQSDIAIGNVVGSNIFNIFWIIGVSAIIRPLPFQPSNNIDIGMATLASLLLFLCFFVGARHILKRWQGALFLIIYLSYLTFLVLAG